MKAIAQYKTKNTHYFVENYFIVLKGSLNISTIIVKITAQKNQASAGFVLCNFRSGN